MAFFLPVFCHSKIFPHTVLCYFYMECYVCMYINCWITIVLVRYMKVMELHWQCQKVMTHVTNLRRFMQSHNYNDKVNIMINVQELSLL